MSDFTSHMSLALEEACAAGERGEVPVGAVLVDAKGHVIAKAGNRTRELSDPTAHAEILVIRAAGAILGSERLTGCDLYVTLEPCAMCAGAIAHARVGRLYYAASDPKGGAVEHGARVFEQPQCFHRPEVYTGIGEALAAELIDRFGPLPDEAKQLLRIVGIKASCKTACIERIDIGPKGAVLTLRNNTFPNPMGLVGLIQKNHAYWKLRPDQKIVVKGDWDTPEERLKVAERITTDLARVAAA